MRRNYRVGGHATLAQEMTYYDSIVGNYEPLTERDYVAILTLLPPEASAQAVLEIGCGSGAFGVRLQKRLTSVVNVGLDVSFNLLSHHPFAPTLGNGQCLPFANASFDLIAASASLHHIHNLAQTLAEIFRCLRPGGRVIFVEPNADHPYRRLVVDGGFLRGWFLKTSDESIFPTDLVAMMSALGFKNSAFQYMTFENRQPSLLGRMQWGFSRLPSPRRLDRFIHPWFVLVSEK